MLADVWFFLWGLLWAMFFVLDGFDFGAGTLMPFVAKNDQERRMLLNATGPFWDANEVWLISAGGVTFAAFPAVYASMFSGLYTALLLLLVMLIIRGVSWEFRSQLATPSWRRLWDNAHFIGSAVPPILLGVAFANIFKGLPIDASGTFHGGLIYLLNPYGLAGGVLFLVLFMMHGALWLGIRAHGDVQARATKAAVALWPVVVVTVVAFLILTAVYTNLFSNYLRWPVLFVVPLLAVIGLISARSFMGSAKWLAAWISSAVTILSVTFFGIIGLFPALLPSSINPAYSLTTANASSSPLTLKIMFTVACIFVPIVLLYQFWAYMKFGKKLTEEDMAYY